MKRLLANLSLLAVGLVLSPVVLAQSTIVNHLTMNQWVQLSSDGMLEGQILLPTSSDASLKDVSVAMMSRDGEVFRSKTNSEGEFSIEGIEPGVYALTARGNNTFACCAMHVVSDKGSESYPEVARVSVANVDYTVVNTAIIRYLPPNVKSNAASISKAKLEGIADQVIGDDLFRVAQSDGGMKGRLHLAGAIGDDLAGATQTNVFIFKDGMQIDRTLTDEDGMFEIDRIKPGDYSLLAIGAGGVGLIGFELVDESEVTETVSNTSNDGTRLVGFRKHRKQGGCCCQEFAMQVAPMPEVVSCVEEVIVSEPIVSAPIEGGCDMGCGCGTCGGGEIIDGGIVMDGVGTPIAGGGFVPGDAGFAPGYGGGGFGPGFGGGGFSGGGGGFGGGFGGGGGLGGLAALGAVGGVIAATSDDDNNAAIFAPVAASPAGP
jgi:uncharacterized membrane protein YgcG